MLLRVSASNLFSFYKEITFDMFPNPRRTAFQNHVYTNMRVPLLKQASIYGANGSGKSNLLYVVDFIKKFATQKEYYKKLPPRLNKFRLIREKNNDPIRVKIEFFHQEIYFLYEIAVNDEKVESEQLWISNVGEKEDELLFKRVGNRVEEKSHSSKDVKNAITKWLESNPLSSLLSMNKEFPILKDERISIAYDWFDKNVQILSLHRKVSSIISLMDHSKELYNFTNKVISHIGLGIQKLEIKNDNLLSFLKENQSDADELQKMINDKLHEGEALSHMKNDKVLFAIEKEKGEAIIKQFIFKQIGLDNYVGDLEYGCQSDGTARLLNLLPALYEIRKKSCVYLIDELECGIHPKLIFELMKFFASEKTKGQLIYTTHETMLLNQQELMRPDEVWFVEKQHGNSTVYSLNDFKEHNTINIVNGYLEGRYGAIPFIGNLDE